MPESSPKPPAEVDGRNRIFHDDLLDHLVGKWYVKGTIVGGRPIEHVCDAEWTLNHQFLKVHFLDVGAGARAAGRPQYEALVFIGYDNMSARYVVHWIDVFGGRFSETLGYGNHVGDGGSADNAIRFVFEYPDGPLHNTFTWNGEAGTWSIVIRQKDEGGHWTSFADELLVRA